MTARTITFHAAALEAVTEAMEADPSVIVLGDSVADPIGTRGAIGLVEKFGPGRVVRTPIAEEGMTGICNGMAMGGLRPLQVHIRGDFSLIAANQLINIAAKVRYMYGGNSGGVPLTVWMSIGRSWGQGAQHSQGLHALYAHIPGLRVVMPSTPADAKGAMAWALRDSKDPVVFMDHMMLRKTTGEVVTPKKGTFASVLYPNSGPTWFRQPRGHGGKNHITIVATSYMVVEALRAAAHLETLGIRCAVFDPLWIRPLPCVDAVADSVQQTQKLLVVDCGWPSFGFCDRMISAVSQEIGFYCRFTSAAMGFAETTCPTSRAIENLYYPNAATIAAKAFEMVMPEGESMPAWDRGAAPEEVKEFRGPF